MSAFGLVKFTKIFKFFLLPTVVISSSTFFSTDLNTQNIADLFKFSNGDGVEAVVAENTLISEDDNSSVDIAPTAEPIPLQTSIELSQQQQQNTQPLSETPPLPNEENKRKCKVKTVEKPYIEKVSYKWHKRGLLGGTYAWKWRTVYKAIMQVKEDCTKEAKLITIAAEEQLNWVYIGEKWKVRYNVDERYLWNLQEDDLKRHLLSFVKEETDDKA